SLEGQLLDGALHGGSGQGLVDAGQLEEDAAGMHDGDPQLGISLARAHAGLGWLLRDRLVGEDADPDLAATLHVAGHRDTGRLDLARREPARLDRLDPEVAERDRGPALGGAVEASALRLAVLHLFG